MASRTLHITVGCDPETTLSQAADAMKALEAGSPPTPYFEVGFTDVGQLFAVFTPARWALLAILREAGPLTIPALATRLKRDEESVSSDVTTLIEWTAIENNENGLMSVPYADISVYVRMSSCRPACG